MQITRMHLTVVFRNLISENGVCANEFRGHEEVCWRGEGGMNMPRFVFKGSKIGELKCKNSL
jgi:hypothetical protein